MRRAAARAAGVAACLSLMGIWFGSASGQNIATESTTLPDPAPVSQPPTLLAPMATPALPTGVAVGRTKGSFAVSPTGQATYIVPLWIPKGIAGMQPALALAYSSDSGDGLYGVGWNISGLLAITRCAKTVTQDNLAANVFLTSSDLYCLNGNKLRSFGGTTYGADGAQYQTEVADFSLVISHGVDATGTGPLWFEVHAKNGLIYQYGNTTDSALLATGTHSVITWALNRITDRFGNHIDYVYTNDTTNQTQRISTITYTTPSSAAVTNGAQSTPNYQIQFTYVSRSSPVPGGFITGAQFMEPYLAQTITVAALSGGSYAAVRTYNLAYIPGTATGRSLLNTIQECSPTQCFSPTTIGYQYGSTGWGTAITTAAVTLSVSNSYVGDINGDGIDDIVYIDKTTGAISYLLGTTTGTYQGPYSGTGITGALVTTLDYNGDGRMDILSINSGGNLRVNFFSSAGSAFTFTDTSTPAPPNPGLGSVMVGDVDGDGRDDLIYAYYSGSSWTSPDYIYYRLNTGSGFGPQAQLAQIGSATCVVRCVKLYDWPFGQSTHYNSRVRRADFNGDGRTDIMVSTTWCNLGTGSCTAPTYHWSLYISDASSNTYDPLDVVTYGASQPTGMQPLVGDFNGDGCSDLAYIGSSGLWAIQYGTCLRTGSAFALSAAINPPISHTPVFPMAIDWDGDGWDDIVDTDGSTWGYAHSTGTSFGAYASTGIAYHNADTTVHTALAADVYGDGHYGIVFPATSTFKITALPHSGQGIIADLATSFTDGFNFKYNPTYTQITNSTHYTKGTGAAYPEQDFQGAANVVSSYTVSDGISLSGTYSVSEFYHAARLNIAGRGFEGYGYIRSLDSRNSLYTYNHYSLAFPNTGMLAESDLNLSTTGTLYAATINTNTSATLDTTYKRYFPYTSQSVSSTYEFGGGLDGTLITKSTTTYGFGGPNGPNGFNYGNPTQIETTTIDEDPTSPWTGKSFTRTLSITPYELGGTTATGWCIHLPSQIAETRTQPAPGGTLTHTTSYQVNQSSDCEVDKQTVEPGTIDQVVTGYSYTDGCGNVNSVTLTGQKPDGTAMSGRTSTAAFGTHCIFPENFANALGQPTVLGYRYDLGLPTSRKDPNLLQTTWTFNDIGQKTLEQRPDGTQTSYGLTGCASNCGFSVPMEYYLTTQEEDSTTSHAAFRNHYDYYDQLDRLIEDEVQNADAQLIATYTAYDSLGRVAKRSSPYLASGSTVYYTTTGYDLLNRVSSTSRPISATNPTVESTNFTYQGRTQTAKDPKGYTTKRQSDAIGELSIVTDPDGVSKTNYGYDPFSNLTSIKDAASNATTRTFDALGYLLTGSSDPDRGTWTFQYDSLGELVNLRDAKTTAPAWTQQLTYDALGRTLTRAEAEGTTTWTWGTSSAAHEIGQLAGLSGLGDIETYTFDSAGRPYQRTMSWGGPSYTVTFAYNFLGMIDQLTYPIAAGQTNPFAVKYGYSNGYLSSLQNYTGSVGGTTFWALTPGVTNVDPWGHITDEILGTTSAVRIQSAFDGVTGWIGTRTVGSGGSLTNLSDLAYQWDLNGNLSQRQDVNRSLTEAITYDNLNRFQNSTLNGTQNQALVIDNTGNITSRTSFGTTYPYTYDATHKHAVAQLGSPAVHTYTYDSNGNMLTRDGQPFIWASFNLPTSLNSSGGIYANFYYGPDRQRKQQAANYNAEGDSGIETTIYVFGLYEHETTPAQTHDKYFLQIPGGTQVVYDIQSISGTQTTYITSDHLGSATVVLSSAGSVLTTESYEAFGRRRAATWNADLSSTDSSYATIAATTRRGFTDAFHESLDNVSLIHMNGRVYDPIAGRFLSPDPVVTHIGDSQRGNPYSYVKNNPLSSTDPTGLTGCAIGDVNCTDNGVFTASQNPNSGTWTLTADPGYVYDAGVAQQTTSATAANTWGANQLQTLSIAESSFAPIDEVTSPANAAGGIVIYPNSNTTTISLSTVTSVPSILAPLPTNPDAPGLTNPGTPNADAITFTQIPESSAPSTGCDEANGGGCPQPD